MRITTREKRVIAIGVCVVVAVLGYYAVNQLLQDRETLSQDVNLKKRMLLRQREILSLEESYRTRLEQLTKQLELDTRRLLPGDNYNVAAAELQNILKDFADQSGVEITQKSILQEKKVQDLLIKVSVRIDTNCNLEQLVQLLTAIRNYDKYLRIDDFNISTFRIRREIRPSLTVSGYISAPEETS